MLKTTICEKLSAKTLYRKWKRLTDSAKLPYEAQDEKISQVRKESIEVFLRGKIHDGTVRRDSGGSVRFCMSELEQCIKIHCII
jgi:hypothetical protein